MINNSVQNELFLKIIKRINGLRNRFFWTKWFIKEKCEIVNDIEYYSKLKVYQALSRMEDWRRGMLIKAKDVDTYKKVQSQIDLVIEEIKESYKK